MLLLLYGKQQGKKPEYKGKHDVCDRNRIFADRLDEHSEHHGAQRVGKGAHCARDAEIDAVAPAFKVKAQGDAQRLQKRVAGEKNNICGGQRQTALRKHEHHQHEQKRQHGGYPYASQKRPFIAAVDVAGDKWLKHEA